MPDERYRLAELREQRNALHQQMDAVITAADNESRSLTAEDEQSLERLETEFRTMTTDIERRERLAGFDTSLSGGGVPQPTDDVRADEVTRRSEVLGSTEYRNAYAAYLSGRETPEQRSTLQVGVDADGGYTVPETWTSVLDFLREGAVLRGLATVVSAERGGLYHVPRVASITSGVTAVAENAAAPDDAPNFDEVVVGDTRYAVESIASVQALQDSLATLESMVPAQIGEALGLALDVQYTVGAGDGITAPAGLFPNAPVAGAAIAALGYDQIIDLVYSLSSPYRKGASFLTHDTTIAALRKIKDSDGRPLWEPGWKVGEPDRLLGYQVNTSPNAPVLGAGHRPVAFGDFGKAYLIKDVAGISIQYLDQTRAKNGQRSWIGALRTGGRIVQERAVRVLEQAA